MKFTNKANDEDMNVLPFGKHKGKSIDDVPDEYILYMCANFDDGSTWRTRADAEYQRRKFSASTVALPFGKHEGTLICNLEDDYIKWFVMNLTDNSYYPLVMGEAEERGLDLCQWDQQDRSGDDGDPMNYGHN